MKEIYFSYYGPWGHYINSSVDVPDDATDEEIHKAMEEKILMEVDDIVIRKRNEVL